MTLRLIRILAIGTLLVSLCDSAFAEAQGEETFSYLDVFELEYAEDPQISPDADRVVYVRKSMDIMRDRKLERLWIIDADGKNHRKLTSTEANESSPRWSPDGERIAYVKTGMHGKEVFVHWLSTGQHARFTQLPRTPKGLQWSPDGKYLAFSMLVKGKAEKLADLPKAPPGAKWADPPRVITMVRHERDGSGRIEPGYYHLFVLPAEGGTPRQITSGNYHHKDPFQWTPDSKSLIFSTNRNADWEYNYRDTNIYTVSVENGSVETLTSEIGPEEEPCISPDGKHIAFTGNKDKMQTYQLYQLRVMDREGKNVRTLTPKLDRDAEMLAWHPNGKEIFFLYDEHGATKIGTVELDGNQMTTLCDDVGGRSMGRPYSSGQYSVAKDGTVAYTRTDYHHPADVAIVSKGKKPRQLTHLNADLIDHRKMGEVEEFWYESGFDGRKIQAWLVTPPDFDAAQKYPLLLEIHGGPISNYGSRYSTEMQLYAAAGYVVLYVNPRGSTGYGEEFGNLLFHDFPGHDYDDLMSAVDKVLERGFIDPDQLYVTGGSSGGTMTAWIVGKTNRFRAAAVGKPVINWLSKTLVADNYFQYHNNRYPGLPWENPEGYLRDSPLMLASNVSTPTLVFVGTSDLRTPPSEAKQFYHALKLRKVKTALVEIPGASHGIGTRPSQLNAKVAHILGWFERHRGKDD